MSVIVNDVRINAFIFVIYTFFSQLYQIQLSVCSGFNDVSFFFLWTLMYKLNLKMGQDLVDSRLKQKIEMDECLSRYIYGPYCAHF